MEQLLCIGAGDFQAVGFADGSVVEPAWSKNSNGLK
jgi:hypothetical protein